MKPVPLAAALCLLILAHGWSQAPAASPTPAGMRVFTVGHSFHFWVPPMLEQVAKSAGIQGHQIAGVMSLGGSTVLDCWNIPKAVKYGTDEVREQPKENTAKQALAEGKVDVLTLSPIWMPDEGIEKFAALGLEHNPNIRVMVQEFWVPNDTYEPVYPLDVRKTPTVDHDATDLQELRKAQDAYLKDLTAYVDGVNAKLGKPVLTIVPVGEATLALREKIAAGQAPGLAKPSELFRDPWGHPLKPLRVLAAYCYYAAIYGRSPVGLPMPNDLQGPYRNEELNRLLQELAWNAVSKQAAQAKAP